MDTFSQFGEFQESLSQKNINRTPIILQHGLLDDSWTWFMLKGKRSLPFILVEDGYDVWLPNIRGNMFSSAHVNKTMDHRNPFGPYWDFSFSEMSDYDLPAVVNYIKSLAHFNKIDYIGHSQGTTFFFLKYMADPEYIKQNIKKFVALGPVPSVSNIESPVVKMLAKDNFFKKYYPTKNGLNLGTEIGKYLYLLCGPFNELCKATAEAMGSMSKTGRVNYKAIQKLFRYEPGGTSKQNVKHWLQCFNSKRMERYDYGKEEKLKKYGSEYPPVYDYDTYKTWDIDTFITFTETDPFSSYDDVYNFINRVEDQSKINVLKLVDYNHLDYLWAECAKEDIFDKIVDFLHKDN